MKQTTSIQSTGETWDLPKNGTMRLPRGQRATVVRVERGTVLITQEGDLEDHVLEASDEFVISADGGAVAWAFTDAAIATSESALTPSKLQRPGHLGGLLAGASR